MTWPEDDWRYGHPEWTLVRDAQGTRFVPSNRRKRRKGGTPKRFADLQPGAILIYHGRMRRMVPGPAPVLPVANENSLEEVSPYHGLAMVTDRWFDPVAGQHDAWAGEMVGWRAVTSRGTAPNKNGTTLRGLAQLGYHPATPEQTKLVSDWMAALVSLLVELDANRITPGEARMRHRTWAQLMHDLGLEP